MPFSRHSQHKPTPSATALKLKWEPEVYLVSRSTANWVGMNDFLESVGVPDWESDAPSPGDYLPEVAGRLCYLSYKNPRPGGNKAYLEHILEVGHGSVLEHTNFGFIFAGVSRSLTHELVRHRAGMAYSQLSQRYVDESDVAFIIPPALLPSAQASLIRHHCSTVEELAQSEVTRRPFLAWRDACEMALSFYRDLLPTLEASAPSDLHGTDKRKWARQAARSVLPNCTETMIFVTGNARAWRHFLEMRGSRHAEVEIRRLTVMILDVLQQEAPNLFADYRREKLPDGTWEILTDHRKV